MEYIGKCSALSLLKETSKTSNLYLYLALDYTWLCSYLTLVLDLAIKQEAVFLLFSEKERRLMQKKR